MAARELYLGASETGKSTLARSRANEYPRVIVFDPSGDYERHGMKTLRSLPALSEYIAKHWRIGFRVCYMPPMGQEPQALHAVSDLIFRYQSKLYRQNHARADALLLIVEEIATSFTSAIASRSDLGGFSRVILQGRHYGISLFGISQRPADIASRLRDNTTARFVFALEDHTSRESILKHIGPQYRDTVARLRRHEFLDVRGGVVKASRLTPAQVAGAKL